MNVLITNLEPCTMCASALIQARMGKVVFGTWIKKEGLEVQLIYHHKSSHHKMEVIGVF